MTPSPQTPRQSLNKAFLKIKPVRSDIERFKAQLAQMLERAIPAESEEFHKNLISDFLKKTGFEPGYYINTKGRNDLVIHNGKNAKSTVGVIIEAKRLANKTEMPGRDNLNTKAFHELILYYLRERISGNNLEIKHLIATNIYEWFIFDAAVFEKAFAQDKKLVHQFEDFEAGRLAGNTTDFFYTQVAAPAVENLKTDIPFTWFDIRDLEKSLAGNNEIDESRIIALYKLLSPGHLLKQPFVNDSNSLDKRFYSELLHIIGLQETKQGSKKLIGRADPENRNPASLIENAIVQLDSLDMISRLENPGRFGDSYSERLFNVALELAITWINRILFLKLLEAQLISYHKDDRSYSFLTNEKIRDFDDLNSLFFQVLARKADERGEDVNAAFQHVPYLNSSLFEPSALEHETLFISNLRDTKKLPLLSATVLKDETGKRRNGELPALSYLFDFLDAYDFAAEGSATVLEDNKSLINASVLGLIFEKINGYKEGSFFTPGFITMYMSRETIRRAVVQKFNEAKGWQCRDLDELYNKINDRNEANDIINSLKIVDPAVGSGHFLVSALNEIIAIKNDLDVLQDKNGRRLKNYRVEVENDELMVTDEDGEFFVYNYNSPESRRVQETLFREKQTIIENCLFGVDINPNSVNICRLRLWIELLKNAYYNDDNQLETLPNLDINIKCGNSLISRFALDADLGEALKKSKWTIDSYRLAVDRYRNAQDKEEKREMEQLINDIKSDFRSEIAHNDPKLKRLSKLKGELTTLTTQTTMFEMSAAEKKAWSKKVDKLTAAIKKIETELEEIKNNKIFENAFEWRFEFPEVLNEAGDFTGFDVVIGNPPYIRIQDLHVNESILKYYNDEYYSTGSGNYDLYIPFIELGYRLLSNNGDHCFIIPHKFINANYGEKIREFISQQKYLRKLIHFGASQVFEDATTYTGIFFFSKEKKTTIEFYTCDDFDNLNTISIPFQNTPYELLTKSKWVFLSEQETQLLLRLLKQFPTLEELTDRIFQGLKTSADKIFILEMKSELADYYEVLCRENNKRYQLEKAILFPLIKGGNSRAYQILDTELLILFPYENGELIKSDVLSNNYPKIWSYFNEHKNYLEGREKGKMKGENWYAFGRNQAIDTISQPKIFTPDIAPNPRISHDVDGRFMFTGGVSGGYGITAKSGISPLYLLAMLNSNVAYWYIKKTSTQMRGGWYSFESRYIKTIPIPQPDHVEKIETIVNQIIETKNQNPAADTTALEKEIDRLVYELYGLTEEEIGIVEGE